VGAAIKMPAGGGGVMRATDHPTAAMIAAGINRDEARAAARRRRRLTVRAYPQRAAAPRARLHGRGLDGAAAAPCTAAGTATRPPTASTAIWQATGRARGHGTPYPHHHLRRAAKRRTTYRR